MITMTTKQGPRQMKVYTNKKLKATIKLSKKLKVSQDKAKMSFKYLYKATNWPKLNIYLHNSQEKEVFVGNTYNRRLMI